MAKGISNANYTMPMYLQIKEYIYKKICSGEYKVNELIPTEINLAKEFQVSRMTVNKAIGELVKQGHLVRFAGKGTFVAEGKHKINRMNFFRFGDSLMKRGYSISSEVLNSEIISPPVDIKNELQINLSSDVYFLRRTRYVNNEPVVVQSTYLNYEYVEGIEKHDFSEASLYNTLKQRHNLEFIRVEDRIQAIVAGVEIGKMLHVDEATPIILLKRTSFIQNDIPVEFTYSYYRSDKHELYIESNSM